jgi:hypothetical protein
MIYINFADMEDKHKHHFVFDKSNYVFLFIGLGLNILGFLLMIGGAAGSPDEFDADALFSPVRITLAPILIVVGYIIIGYGIMKKPKGDSDDVKLDE